MGEKNKFLVMNIYNRKCEIQIYDGHAATYRIPEMYSNKGFTTCKQQQVRLVGCCTIIPTSDMIVRRISDIIYLLHKSTSSLPRNNPVSSDWWCFQLQSHFHQVLFPWDHHLLSRARLFQQIFLPRALPITVFNS